MSDKDLYKKTFSKIKASENVITEVIKMKENKKIKHFPAKKIIAVAAAVCVLLSVSVIANAATDGAIADKFAQWTNMYLVKNGDYTYSVSCNDDVAEDESYTDSETKYVYITSVEADENGKNTAEYKVYTDSDTKYVSEESVEADEDGENTADNQNEYTKILQDYADKQPGEYTETDSQGNILKITVVSLQ